MKKPVILIVTALLALTAVSCDQSRLDIPQQGVLSEDDFYQTDEDCLEALAGVYSGILHSPERRLYTYMYSFLSEMADEVYVCDAGYAVDQLHSYMFFTYDPTVSYLSRVYNDMYAIVYRCNLVIDHFSDGTSAIMKNAVAEAKVIRSWIYIYLVSMFNTPPIVDHVLKTNDEFRQPNSEPEKAWAWIIETLDEAIASGALDSKSDVSDKSKVRATKEFALSLKGKAQVYSGDYAGAKATLEQVIGSGKYALIPGDQLADLFFTSKGNHNCESIFETNSVMTNDNYKTVAASDNWGAYTPVRVDKFRIADGSYLKEYSAGWNHYTPTDKFLRAIIANEGMYSNRFKAWIYDYEILQEMGLVEFSSLQDPSRKEYLASTTMETPDKNCPYGYGADYCAETLGFWQRKLTVTPDDMYNKGYNYTKVNRRYFRYAEVLLLYAEACAQLGETSGKGLEYLNKIAERAGAPTYSTLSMANVKKEKWFEMWGEMTRFFDLVRWGDAETELKDHYTTLPVFFGYKEGKSGADLNADGSNFDQVYNIRYFDVKSYTGVTYSFQKGKCEYFPFPSTEIANNPELKQNPGW